MRKFAGKIQTKEIPFMGDTIEIRKLSTGAIRRIGKASETALEKGDAESLSILLTVLTEGVVLPEGEEPINEELLDEFPIADLNELSQAIMQYAGVIPGDEGNAG